MLKMQSWRRLELWFWASVPSAITLFLLILYLAPKHMAGIGYFMPALPLIPIFYWGLLHAHEMPYWFVFALGMVLDAVTGAPLGLSSLLYIFFLAILHAQRKYIAKEGFVIKWVYFAMLMGITSVLNWLLMFFLNGQAQGLLPGFMQWFLTVCCYPLLHRAFDILYDHINARRWRLLHR